MYNLELEKVAKEINERKSKQVLIQLPDGLKHKSHEVVDFLEKETDSNIFLWFGSCFGACDLPLGLDVLKIDLIVSFGHNRFNKEKW